MAIQIRVVGTPVVYTNNAGGGADEIQAPTNAQATMQLHAGAQVQQAWYSPLDNIGDLPAIHMIDCSPNGNHVALNVGGIPGQRDARVRLKVYAAVEV